MAELLSPDRHANHVQQYIAAQDCERYPEMREALQHASGQRFYENDDQAYESDWS